MYLISIILWSLIHDPDKFQVIFPLGKMLSDISSAFTFRIQILPRSAFHLFLTEKISTNRALSKFQSKIRAWPHVLDNRIYLRFYRWTSLVNTEIQNGESLIQKWSKAKLSRNRCCTSLSSPPLSLSQSLSIYLPINPHMYLFINLYVYLWRVDEDRERKRCLYTVFSR